MAVGDAALPSGLDDGFASAIVGLPLSPATMRRSSANAPQRSGGARWMREHLRRDYANGL
jgi:hypothetical protein